MELILENQLAIMEALLSMGRGIQTAKLKEQITVTKKELYKHQPAQDKPGK